MILLEGRFLLTVTYFLVHILFYLMHNFCVIEQRVQNTKSFISVEIINILLVCIFAQSNIMKMYLLNIFAETSMEAYFGDTIFFYSVFLSVSVSVPQ